MIRKGKWLAPVLALGISVFAGCGTDTADEPDTTEFIYARKASTTSFDLHQEVTQNNAFAISQVFEPLVMFNEEGIVEDYLADSSISDDGLVYTFVLHDGLKFSNGEDVTAEDVKYSLERHLEIGGPLPIEADIVSIEAKDDRTVVITLGEAYTPFYSELANFSNGILPKDLAGMSEDEFFSHPIGTGPFVVEEWDPSGDIVYVKNPYYWQEGKPGIDRLVFRYIEDDNQLINQLRAGSVHAVEELSYANAKAIDENADTYVITAGSWTVEELFFNTLDEHMSDVHVRRALALAIDREQMTEALTFGYGETANTVLPNALRYNESDTVQSLELDLEQARWEMSQSAWPEGFSTTINIASGNNVRLQEAQIIKDAGAKIGIDITINAQEIATFRQDFRNFNFVMMINSAVADYPDANSIFAFQVDPNGFSQCYWTNYKSDTAVDLMNRGRVTPDGDERAAIYKELQQVLADDVPYIPLYYPDIVVGVRGEVEGLVILPNGCADFTDVVLK